MEDPPIAIHTPHNPKKRLFTGSSSSSFNDADVIEIPPPATWTSKRSKHKSIADHQVIVVDDEDSDDVVIINEKIAPKSKGKKPVLSYLGVHDVSSKQPNGFVKNNSSSHVSYVNNDSPAMDLLDSVYDDECAMLQAHFDSIDIPSGIEATVPWWPAPAGGGKSAVSTTSSPVLGSQSYSNSSSSKLDKFQQWSSAEPFHTNVPVSKPMGPSMKHSSMGYTTYPVFNMQNSGLIPEFPQWLQHPGMNISSIPNKLPSMNMAPVPGWHPSKPQANFSYVPGYPSPFPSAKNVYMDPLQLDENITAEISPPSNDGQEDTSENHILKKLELFQRFDSVEDPSGHHYIHSNEKESCNQPKSWKKKIFAEWEMLKSDLPDTIFVRIYETRMDLLRAAILGADGTPYHDGLFFFDVYFTPSYPAAPPRVNYHAHGLRINPNLYNCGKVCLSLLGTWSGRGNENWRPGKSNMLQVLVSIQGLILNAEPYYNEPGFARSKNSSASKDYSENAFLLSLKTMLYTLKNPPKYFEDLVYGHFFRRAHDILAACRAYLDGVQIGSFVKGKSPVVQTTVKGCSQRLKTSLPGYIKSLVEAFTKIGVKNCENFLVSVKTGSSYQSTSKSHKYQYKSKH